MLLGLVLSIRAQVCGDGSIGGGEQCDDSNTAPNDGCSATCQCESLNVDIEILEYTPYICEQGDLVHAEFQIIVPTWAQFDGAECSTPENWAPATCNASHFCTCDVAVIYSDLTWTTTGNPIEFDVETWFYYPVSGCGWGNYSEVTVELYEQCGWCTDDSNCTSGCGDFYCDNVTGYCTAADSTYDVSLTGSCELEFCVTKQCADSIRGEEPCVNDLDCPQGACVAAYCVGGSSNGEACYHTDLDRRRATAADFDEGYLYACYSSGGQCVQGSDNSTVGVIASYALCDDNDPCTADHCTVDLPIQLMCSHAPQACSDESVSPTPSYITFSVLGAVVVVLIGVGFAVFAGYLR